MKTFSNELTQGLSALIKINDGTVLTGSQNGLVQLWSVERKEEDYQFDRRSVFAGHSKKVYHLKLLPNNCFLSCSADSLRIWDMNSGACRHILSEGSIYEDGISSTTLLPDDLLVIGGYSSPAWQAFDVWDIRTGKCLFKEESPLHRPWGFLTEVTAQGELVVQGRCIGGLKLWKVTRKGCKALDKEVKDYEGNDYSLSIQPTGEIIAASSYLYVYAPTAQGDFQRIKVLENSNVIDDIFPLGRYRILTVDRQNRCSGTLKLWNYLTGSCEWLGDSRTPSGDVAESHVVFPKTGIVLSVGDNAFCIQKFPSICRLPAGLVEIQKNACLLSQACRTKTSFFTRLPLDLNVKIAALTGGSQVADEKSAIKWAAHCFSLPRAVATKQSDAKDSVKPGC